MIFEQLTNDRIKKKSHYSYTSSLGTKFLLIVMFFKDSQQQEWRVEFPAQDF